MRTLISSILLLLCPIISQAQKLVRYDLVITDTIVNYTGKERKAITINGQLPAPTLYFTEGDTAEIHVYNKLHHESSIHWHGLILPNEHDGVPYLTTAPILPHGHHVFRFPIVQNGTYWYHSHTMLQEQVGMYGAFIIHKREKSKIPEYTMLLSDWSDENPHQIERSLHYATDWYAIKKGAAQSYGEAIKAKQLGTKFENEFKRMAAMDVSDVYYDRVLSNGKPERAYKNLQPGDSIRIRIINGSASTYFWLSYAGGKISVVASDGMDVVPVGVDRLIVGVSESYDVIVKIPEAGSYELRATSEDRTNYTSLWLGEGKKNESISMPRLNYFEGMSMMNDMMTVDAKMNDMGMDMSLQQMDMNAVMYRELTEQAQSPVTLNYAMLASPVATTLPKAPTRTLHFTLTGNMNRYIWTMDNRTISESDKILIKKGENIRIVLTNNSMMRHPMHLHGHFFRIVNGQGDYAPLKNVLDIMPMETDTIEFHASEEYGDWYFHCHILYHMMSGMGKIFSYENSPPNPQLPDPKKALRKVYRDDKRFYLGASIGLESNGSDGEVMLSNTRWMMQSEWRLGLNSESGYETELHLGRFIGRNQFLFLYSGWDQRYRSAPEVVETIFGQTNTSNKRGVACFGFQYTMPWFIVADWRVDHTGIVRLQISRDDIPLTQRIRLWANVNSDLEYSIGARYILSKYVSLSTHYDSDMKLGGGIRISY
ncbi:MAG: copper oxidase [Cytophagia bacterium]|nr:copper oxidase [Cytophagia bacterium]